MYRILSRLFPGIIWSKNQNTPYIYLTFDDGPHPEYTPRILDILKAYNSKATFFIIGKKANEYPHIVSRIAEDGHTIGLHSYSHEKLIFKSRDHLLHELMKPQKIVKKITGIKPDFFRPPYGYFTPRLLRICADVGLKVIMWTILSYDFNPQLSDQRMINRIDRQFKNGAIHIFHDGHINSKRTVKILPDIIETILLRGKLLASL